jgi:hypothetical protein
LRKTQSGQKKPLSWHWSNSLSEAVAKLKRSEFHEISDHAAWQPGSYMKPGQRNNWSKSSPTENQSVEDAVPGSSANDHSHLLRFSGMGTLGACDVDGLQHSFKRSCFRDWADNPKTMCRELLAFFVAAMKACMLQLHAQTQTMGCFDSNRFCTLSWQCGNVIFATSLGPKVK